MNLILQDIVEPKVLGDSLHLHPVPPFPLFSLFVDRNHQLSCRLGDHSRLYRRCLSGSSHCMLQDRDA